MILFCDSSALVKLYLVEDHSPAMKKALTAAETAAVARVAWAEAFAAFARRERETPADRGALRSARKALASDWPHYLVLDASQSVVERSGDYAETFALRAYDSIQLATAQELAQLSGARIAFACFDSRLNKAAKTLGMDALFGELE